MSDFSNLEGDVEKEAKDHPDQETSLVDKGEQEAENASGHRDDSAVNQAGQDLEKDL
jgi:hypothetical protein